jgi:hypothetical protein
MDIAHATPLEKLPARNLCDMLKQEAGELETLHAGLRRHLTAWRDAHERASTRLNSVTARIDALLARAGHTGG